MADLKKKRNKVNVLLNTTFVQTILSLLGLLMLAAGLFLLVWIAVKITDFIFGSSHGFFITVGISIGAFLLAFLLKDLIFSIRAYIICNKMSVTENQLNNFASFEEFVRCLQDTYNHVVKYNFTELGSKLSASFIFYRSASISIYNYLVLNQNSFKEPYLIKLRDMNKCYNNTKMHLSYEYNAFASFAQWLACVIGDEEELNIEEFFETPRIDEDKMKFFTFDTVSESLNLDYKMRPALKKYISDSISVMVLIAIIVVIGIFFCLEFTGFITLEVASFFVETKINAVLCFFCGLMTFCALGILRGIFRASVTIRWFVDVSQYLPLSNEEFETENITSYQSFEDYMVNLFEPKSKFTIVHGTSFSSIAQDILRRGYKESFEAFCKYAKENAIEDEVLQLIENRSIKVSDFCNERLEQRSPDIYHTKQRNEPDTIFETIFYKFA